MNNQRTFELLGIPADASTNHIHAAVEMWFKTHDDPEERDEMQYRYYRLLAASEMPANPDFGPDYEQVNDRLEYLAYAQRSEDLLALCKEALPADSDICKYYTAIAYRDQGKPGKAAKILDKLSSKDPDNVFYARELGLAYYARELLARASKHMQRAYEMGEQSIDFLTSLAVCYSDRRMADKAEAICLEIIDKGQYELVFSQQTCIAYTLLLKQCDDVFDGKFTEEQASKFLALALQALAHAKAHREVGETAYPLIARCIDNANALVDYLDPFYTSHIYSVLQVYKEDPTDPDVLLLLDEHENKENLGPLSINLAILEAKIAAKDEKLLAVKHLQNRIHELSFPHPANTYPGYIDTSLCVLKTRKDILPLLDYIKENYPSYYQKDKELLSTLKDDKASFTLFAKQKAALLQMTSYVKNSHFSQDFPEEFPEKI